MMKHEEDGRLMAYLDGELAPEEVGTLESHLGSCPDCALTTSRLENERSRVRAALPELDVSASGAARRVRERLSRETPVAAPSRSPSRTAHPARRPSWIRRSRVLQAALFVLFVAGGASAVVPGSPLRRWLEGGGATATAPTSAPASLRAPVVESAAQQQSSIGGLPAAGKLRVVLALPVGTELSVVFVDGERATVHANPGTDFLIADGLVQATVLSGPVRVELPRRAPDVSLEVGGQSYLRMQNGQVLFKAPPADSSEAEFMFRIR